MARTTSPRTTTKKTAARKTAAKKTTTPRPRKQTQPRLSLVKPTPPRPHLERRPQPFMTDTQGYATLAARLAGITTPHINDWRDHSNDTCTRALTDGSTLHYDLPTRTLTWQAVCPMGAIHEYVIDSPSTACAARVHADRCTTPHHDLSTVQPLTADELADLGILHTPTWARRLPGDPDITETIPIPLPTPRPAPRALGDQLTRTQTGTTDTQPMNTREIAAGLTARADQDQPKGHPQS